MLKRIKALGMNMEAIRGNGMVYEMNKEYTYDDNIKCGQSGYHYFDSIRDLMCIYDLNETRIFECELNGDKFDHDDIVHCTNKIKLIREITEEEILNYISNEDKDVRKEAARQGYGLHRLVNDKYGDVRLEVARHEYGLHQLVNDTDSDVRREVARQGYGLYELNYDKDCEVRMEVAKQGYGLDVLVNDEDREIRLEVARQGYGLDVLVNDKDWSVRSEVAKQGYGLDVLVNDKNEDVRREAIKQLELRNNKEN